MIDRIRVSGVSKSFRLRRSGERQTLKDVIIRGPGSTRVVHALSTVSFDVEPGSMVGVIGQNGCGKTTLLRIIAGILRPDTGTVVVEGSISAVMMLGTGFHPDLTGREGARIELLAMGLSRKQTENFLPAVAEFAAIGDFFDAPIRTYSSGMAMRLAFACSICIDPDVLLLDEVLAVGDEAFAVKCVDTIHSFRERGKTIVLVTHNADFVAQYCDMALWLDCGRVAGLGDPRAVVAAYHALSDQPLSEDSIA